jgi:hypothetical protein
MNEWYHITSICTNMASCHNDHKGDPDKNTFIKSWSN